MMIDHMTKMFQASKEKYPHLKQLSRILRGKYPHLRIYALDTLHCVSIYSLKNRYWLLVIYNKSMQLTQHGFSSFYKIGIEDPNYFQEIDKIIQQFKEE